MLSHVALCLLLTDPQLPPAGATPEPDRAPILQVEPRRPGRTRVELVLLGDPWPEAVARVLRYSGTEERPKQVLEDFVDGRRGLWTIQAREFGLEIAIEAPDEHFGAVWNAVTPTLTEPRWTSQARELARSELLVARVPGQFDPVAYADRTLASLLDPSVTPAPILQVDLGELMGGGGDGEAAQPPGLEALELERLGADWRALRGGPRAARIAADDPSSLEASVRELFARLGTEAREESGPSRVESDRSDPAQAPLHAAYAADAMTPGALLGWATELGSEFDGWSTAELAAWSAGLRATIGERLDLQAGTAPRIAIRRGGEGVASVRVVALVEPTPAMLALLAGQADLEQPLAVDPEAFATARADSGLGGDPLGPLLEAALALGAGERSADAGDPPTVRFTHRLSVADEDRLGSVWRLDRTPLEQSEPAAVAVRERLFSFLGGAQAWASPSSVAIRTEVEVAPGQVVASDQWRDLRGERLRLVQLGTPQVVTTLAGGRATQRIDDGQAMLLPEQTATALVRSHRSSLLVTLADLARGQLRVRLSASGEPEDSDGERFELLLEDRSGDRGVLIVAADGRPLELVQGTQSYAYAEWFESGGRRVPAHVERRGGRPVVYRWSDVVWDAPAPKDL